jgi:hypothetical protein
MSSRQTQEPITVKNKRTQQPRLFQILSLNLWLKTESVSETPVDNGS